MSLEVFKLHTKARRNLKRSRLAPMYTQEELEVLMKSQYTYSAKPTLSHIRWSARFGEISDAARNAKPRKIRKWSPEEDDFLRSTYMYLTDSTIALALNIPANIVLARRVTLKLFKDLSNNLETMVWCERDNFDDDVKKLHLQKARPDVII